MNTRCGEVSFSGVEVDVSLRVDECMDALMDILSIDEILGMVNEREEGAVEAWADSFNLEVRAEKVVRNLIEMFGQSNLLDLVSKVGGEAGAEKWSVDKLKDNRSAVDLVKMLGIAMKVSYRLEEDDVRADKA